MYLVIAVAVVVAVGVVQRQFRFFKLEHFPSNSSNKKNHPILYTISGTMTSEKNRTSRRENK